MRTKFAVLCLISALGFTQCSFINDSYVEDADCGLNMKMIYVDGGTFNMGGTVEQGTDVEDDERLVHPVELDSYYIAECEVTQEQWFKIMGTTIEYQRNLANPTYELRGVGSDTPIYYVSWDEAQAFCQALSRRTGKTYMLPTEAQWEYAARGGKADDGTKYSGFNYLDAVAWYKDNSGEAAHPVKRKTPNSLGLYDMSGNVWEWCRDYYGDYTYSIQTNPEGPLFSEYRVVRGGAWIHKPKFCRVSCRIKGVQSQRYNRGGFRVVCIPSCNWAKSAVAR